MSYLKWMLDKKVNSVREKGRIDDNNREYIMLSAGPFILFWIPLFLLNRINPYTNSPIEIILACIAVCIILLSAVGVFFAIYVTLLTRARFLKPGVYIAYLTILAHIGIILYICYAGIL